MNHVHITSTVLRHPLTIFYRDFVHITDRLPEAICCCFQTCSVNVVMCCICILAFIVTGTDISKLWVYLCYLQPVAICCCLVMFMERE